MNIAETFSEHKERYFAWMYERQLMWYRRFVLRAPAPWTDDPHLSTYRFTNTFRELDRGSIYSLQRVVDKGSRKLEDTLMRVVIYRIFNRASTYDKVFYPIFVTLPKKLDWAAITESLKVLHEKESIFTGAHVVSTFGAVKGESTKLEKVTAVLEELESLCKLVVVDAAEAGGGMESYYKALQKHIPGVGEFLAYEICCDLAYAPLTVSWDEDSWAHAGPGARDGLKLLFPDRFPNKASDLELMKELRAQQGEYFMNLGLPIYLVWPQSARFNYISLRDIEGGLCEYYKYNNCVDGNFRHRYPYRLGEGYAWR